MISASSGVGCRSSRSIPSSVPLFVTLATVARASLA
jgi:hypothetical protein